MEKRNIIVIGASTGGFEAIKQLVAGLPAGMDASLFIVWHMSPDVAGIMPQMLNKLGTIPASGAIDNEVIRSGRIYVAPPDHHLLLEEGRVRITRGPKENHFRPAIDPLFRSAAFAYGNRVIGVVLTGALDDGAAGLWTIKQFGGIAVIQDPDDAEVPSMPVNALRTVKVDHKVPISEMAELLAVLCQQPAGEYKTIDAKEIEKTKNEVCISIQGKAIKNGTLEFGELSPYTCPECHGVLSAIHEEGNIRFRCHTGHAFSTDSLLASITANIEDNLWIAIRNIQENILFLNHMGDHFSEVNQPKLAALYFRKAKDAEISAQLVRRVVMNHELLNGEGIEQQSREM